MDSPEKGARLVPDGKIFMGSAEVEFQSEEADGEGIVHAPESVPPNEGLPNKHHCVAGSF